MDVRGFQHIPDCTSCYSAAATVSGHKSRSEISLPPANSNSSNGALALVANAIRIKAKIVRIGVTKRRQSAGDEFKSAVQFARNIVGNAVAALLRINQSFRDEVCDCVKVKQEAPRGIN
jgi:hypothetical protein